MDAERPLTGSSKRLVGQPHGRNDISKNARRRERLKNRRVEEKKDRRRIIKI